MGKVARHIRGTELSGNDCERSPDKMLAELSASLLAKYIAQLIIPYWQSERFNCE